MPAIFQTKRLLFRIWNLNDAPAAMTIWGDPEVMKFTGAPPMENLEAVIASLKKGLQVQAEKGFCLWAAVEKASQEIVGCAGFHYFDEGPILEFVVHFARKHWGRGFGTEAAIGCTSYAFDTLGAEKIVAFTCRENVGAQRIMEKSGYTYLGLKKFGEAFEMRYEKLP